MKVKTYLSEKGAVPSGFSEKVKLIVGDENVSAGECDVISYSLDYWMYGVLLSQRGDLPSLPSIVISPGNREEAMAQYRLFWLSYLGLWGNNPGRSQQRRALTEEMDSLQPLIAEGPGPEWFAFTATLPGYDEYWDNPASWAPLHGGRR